ncbi:hypothetical protein WDW37_13030 [Bdellovibrionota bacterium FG-1]
MDPIPRNRAPAGETEFLQLGLPAVWILPEDSWLGWLRQHAPAYQNALKTSIDRRGKIILHQELLIARIKDLSLRVKLEKALPENRQFLTLDEEYVAFPAGLLPIVEKVVRKEGHVIQVVKTQ